MILRLYRFLRGKLKILASGDFVERILNLCTYNGITIWGIRKKGEKLSFYISISDFKRLPKIIRNTGVRVKILKKQGMPFIVNRYRYRYGIAAAVIIFFSLLYFLSGFIWNIKIVGSSQVADEEILSACKAIGISEGVRSSKIDAWDKRVELQLKVDELSWAAINIEGCILTVDVTESKQEDKNDESPCNLVASCDGIIRKIESTNGDIIVHTGDAVTKGSLLVSGIVELSNGNTHFVRAGGKVIAEVREVYSVTVPLRQKLTSYNGKNWNRYTLDFFSVKLPLYLGSIRGNYLQKTERTLLEYKGAYLPISLYKTKYVGLKETYKILTKEEAEIIGKEKINKRYKKAETLEINYEVIDNNNSITIKSVAIVLKDIAKAEKILISTTN